MTVVGEHGHARRGVRFRVTAVAAAALAVVLTLLAVALVLAQRLLLTEALDAAVVTRAAEVARAFGDAEDVTRGGDDIVWQVVGADGTVLGASAALDGLPALRGPAPAGTPEGVAGPVTTVDDSPVVDVLDGPARAVARFEDDARGRRVVLVFGALEEVEEPVAVLRGSMLVAVPAATALLAWVVWVLVGRALAPVEAIRAEVADISGDDLGRRVPVPDADDEVARLASTMNRMLDRLEASVVTRRRFVSDASHELRSPLTRLRTQLETARRGDDVDALRRSLLEDAAELQELVEDLLVLARVDEGRAPVPSRIDLDELVLAEVVRARAATGGHADARSVQISASGVSGAEVLGDRSALQRVVRNLLDNAVRHAETRVEVTLRERAEEVELVVADDGPGVAADDVERVFERFTRLDDARSRDAGGTGLGLAIVREVTEQHGGHVEVIPGVGARFVVVLPGSPAVA